MKISNISMHAFVWAAAFGATAAQAQTAPAGDAVPAETAQDTNDGDIIVTAQRREERLQDVPIAISAFSGDALQSAAARWLGVDAGVPCGQPSLPLAALNP